MYDIGRYKPVSKYENHSSCFYLHVHYFVIIVMHFRYISLDTSIPIFRSWFVIQNMCSTLRRAQNYDIIGTVHTYH